MLPPNCRWEYEPDRIYPRREWLRLRCGEDILAAFLFERDERGRINRNRLTLRIKGEEISKIDVFVSLRNSLAVGTTDKDCLWSWREKIFRFHPPRTEDLQAYMYLSSKARVRALDAYFQTPEGIRWFERLFNETLFEYVTAEDVAEGIRSGDIKVN